MISAIKEKVNGSYAVNNDNNKKEKGNNTETDTIFPKNSQEVKQEQDKKEEPKGFIDKIGDSFKKGVDTVKDSIGKTIENTKEEVQNVAQNIFGEETILGGERQIEEENHKKEETKEKEKKETEKKEGFYKDLEQEHEKRRKGVRYIAKGDENLWNLAVNYTGKNPNKLTKDDEVEINSLINRMVKENDIKNPNIVRTGKVVGKE